MIKIENEEVIGWEHAIRGMRNPMNSWDKSDTNFPVEFDDDCNMYYKCDVMVGDNDLDLMKRLRNAGTDHRKYLRMITVYADITAGHTWWAEFDTYKVGTVRNSCSKMHKIHIKEFVYDDFDHEGIDECGLQSNFKTYIALLEDLRIKFNETKEKKYWRAIIEMLPLGFHIRATIMLNYEVLANMYKSRKAHKLDEWREFCKWIESLPYSELITGLCEEN